MYFYFRKQQLPLENHQQKQEGTPQNQQQKLRSKAIQTHLQRDKQPRF